MKNPARAALAGVLALPLALSTALGIPANAAPGAPIAPTSPASTPKVVKPSVAARTALPKAKNGSSTNSGSGTTTVGPNAYSPTAAEQQALAIVNAARVRYGVPSVSTNPNLLAGAAAHAKYCVTNPDNGCTSPSDPSGEWEDPSATGYTTTGSQYAPFMVMVSTSSPTVAVQTLLTDPGTRDGWLIDVNSTSINIATAGNWTMVLTDVAEMAPATGYPRTFPQGSNVPVDYRSFNIDASSRDQWTQGCPATTMYGFPLSTQWNYDAFGAASASSGTLFMDGVKQATCMARNTNVMLDGQAVMIPMAPLSNGAIYTGTMTGVFPTASGSVTQNKSFAFTTWAAPTGAAGDQSGDAVADFMTVSGSNLYFHKMRPNGTVGANMVISTRYSTSTWFSHIPDVNQDRRDDLLSRNTNGDIYIWYGNGMGSFTQGPKVGISWNSMNKIIAVGDMTGDGTPEMVARDTSGNLWRYTVYADKITNKVLIGKGWGGFKDIIPIGKYNADNRYDIVSIDASGTLWQWNTTTAGAFSTKTKIGTGWGGYTYVFAPGDINKDGRWDLVARDSSGHLWTWFNTTSGLARVSASSANWNSWRLFG